MSSDVSLSTFPSSKIEYLATLYLQQKDLSGYTPEELVDEYCKIKRQMSDYYKKRCMEQKAYDRSKWIY